MARSTRDLVTDYLAAVGERRFEDLGALLHPDATFGGTVAGRFEGREAFVDAFSRLGPIIARNDLREIVVEGDRAFVLYDFVTDTEVGPVLSAELVTCEGGLIRSSILLFDQRRWPEVMQELTRRATPPAVASPDQ